LGLASPGPLADPVQEAVKEAKAQGINVEVIGFSDWIAPNEVLNNRDIDVNYYQHPPFLENASKAKGSAFVSVGVGTASKLGLFSARHKSLAEVPVGGTVAIANDPVNEGRGLVLLEKVGLITLKRGLDYRASVSDITNNPRKLKLVEVVAQQLPRVLQDVDLAEGYAHLLKDHGVDPTGTVTLDGLDVGALGPKALIGLRRRVGMIVQSFNLLSSRTTPDNVALPLVLAGQSRKAARAAARDALALVGLADKADAYPARLSGGQRQRTGIARAIVGKPDLLLSDESTSALDPETTRSVLALLRDINRHLAITIVLITHEMDVIRHVADRVAVLDRGRLVEVGDVARVFDNPSEAATCALLRSDDETSARDRTLVGETTMFSIDVGDHGGAGLDLFAIVTALGPGARLQRGGFEGAGARHAECLYVAGTPRSPDEALARLRAIHPSAEIVRHA
jgi:D-methionine transport system ATP-binding protein